MELNLAFNTKDYEVLIRNAFWNDMYRTLDIEYKIKGVLENNKNAGFFYDGRLSRSKKAILFSPTKIGDKKLGAITLPNDIFEILDNLYLKHLNEDLDKSLNSDINYTLNDNDNYGAYNGISEFDIADIIASINKKLSCNFILSNKEIADILNKDKEILELVKGTYKTNPIQDNWTNDYKEIFLKQAKEGEAPGYGVIPNSFIKDKITKIIINYIENNKRESEDREKVIAEAFKKAKETNSKQLLSCWVEECNNPKLECSTDICYEYAIPDGTIKYERVHAY